MAQLIDIIRVVVGTQYLTATVRISDEAPLMTSEDLEATTRVYYLLPTIIDHACVGDAGSVFRDCMGDTELAHLLEHVTVELLARTNLVDQVMAGRTWRELEFDGVYSIQLDCVDDVLVAAALSSAVWILDWAFSGGYGPVPDVDAIVDGLVDLIHNLPEPGAEVPFEESYEDDLPYEWDEFYDEGQPYEDDQPLGEGQDIDEDALYDEERYEDDLPYEDERYGDEDAYDEQPYEEDSRNAAQPFDERYDDGYGEYPYDYGMDEEDRSASRKFF